MQSRTVIIKIVTVGWKLLLHKLILTGTSTQILIKYTNPPKAPINRASGSFTETDIYQSVKWKKMKEQP